jgi:hypothetical protein
VPEQEAYDRDTDDGADREPAIRMRSSRARR